jgi:hypothetical protein
MNLVYKGVFCLHTYQKVNVFTDWPALGAAIVYIQQAYNIKLLRLHC